MPGRTTTAFFPADSWYALYRNPPAGTGSAAPVIGFVAFYDATLVNDIQLLGIQGIVWDRAGLRFADGSSLPGFTGYVRSYGVEGHYLATEEDLRATLKLNTTISDKDIQGLIENAKALAMAKMIADKDIAEVIAKKFPDPRP